MSIKDLEFDEFDHGQVGFTGPDEVVGIFNCAYFQGVRHPDGSVRELDVLIGDHNGCEALRIPVSQVDEYVEVLRRQRDLALAAKADIELGESV